MRRQPCVGALKGCAYKSRIKNEARSRAKGKITSKGKIKNKESD